jgi:hypothetical protein
MSRLSLDAINEKIAPVERIRRRDTDLVAILEWAKSLSLPVEPALQWLSFDHSEDHDRIAAAAGLNTVVVAIPPGDPLSQGHSRADAIADQGIDLLVLTGSNADESAARVLICVLAASNAGAVAPAFLPESMTDEEWSIEVALIRDRAKSLHNLRGEYLDLLDALAAPSLSMLVSVILHSAARRTPVLLDGVVAHAAALIAQRIAFRSAGWCASIGSVSDDAIARARDRLDISGLHSPIHGVQGTSISLAHMLTALRVSGE